MRKRFLSILLVAAMCFTLLPASAWADEDAAVLPVAQSEDEPEGGSDTLTAQGEQEQGEKSEGETGAETGESQPEENAEETGEEQGEPQPEENADENAEENGEEQGEPQPEENADENAEESGEEQKNPQPEENAGKDLTENPNETGAEQEESQPEENAGKDLIENPEENQQETADADVLAVQEMIDDLPGVQELPGMDADALADAYEAILSAYDAYDALSGEQQAQISGVECFEELFGWFNGQIAPLANEVAVPAEVTTAAGDKTSYDTLSDAIYEANDGDTVKLTESNTTYTLTSDENFPIRIEYNDITLDLNGCTLQRTVSTMQQGILNVSGSVEVTLRNGTLELDDSASDIAANAINMPAGDTPTLTLEDMTITATNGYAIYTQGGTLCIKSGTYGDVLIHDGIADAKLSGGSYNSVGCYNDYAQLLEKGYIFANQSDDSYIDPSSMTADKAVKVIPCTHKNGSTSLFANGECTVCGFVCKNHTETNQDGQCDTCGQALVASDGTYENWYISLSEAFEQTADGGTIKTGNLPKSALEYNYDKSVTLDGLYGDYLASDDANATLTVSAGKLTITASFNPDYPPTIINNGGGCAVEVTGGTLEFADTDYARCSAVLKGGIHVTADGVLEGYLKEGSILTKESGSYSVSVDAANNYEFVYELLEDGYAFAKATVTTDSNEDVNAATTTVGDILPANVAALTEDAIVVKCTHKNGDASLFEDGTCKACGFVCEHGTVANNICSVCNTEMLAQDDAGNYYIDLGYAMEGVADGGTVTMLKTPPEDYDAIGFCYDADGNSVDKTVTLMMNGHSLSYEGSPSLDIQSGKLIIGDDATISQPAQAATPAVSVDNDEQGKDRGTLEFKGNATLTGGLYIQNWGKLVGGLKEGSVITSNGTYSVSVEHSEDTYKTVQELLADGCAFAAYDKDNDTTGALVRADVNKLNEDVIVIAHTHSNFTPEGDEYVCACGYHCTHAGTYENGTCTLCGYTCPHTDVANDVCTDCKAQMAVKVEKDGIPTYYAKHFENNIYATEDTLKEVLNKTENGSTVTLLADGMYASGWVTGKNITLNLNGKNLIENNGIVAATDDDTSTSSQLVITGAGSSKEPDGSRYTCTFRVLNDNTLQFDENFSGTYQTIYLEGGTLTSDSTNMTIAALEILKSGAVVQLKGGNFGKIAVEQAVGSVTLGSLLPEGYCFAQGETLLKYDTTITPDSPIQDVKVVLCNHAEIGNDGTCATCGKTGIQAVLTKADGDVETFVSSDSSIDIFNGLVQNGGTLKLYSNFAYSETMQPADGTSMVIDLNGHKVTPTSGSAAIAVNAGNLTILDSSEDKTGLFDSTLNLSGTASLTVESGASLGKIVVSDRTAKVALKEGSQFSGYEIPYGMMLADWLEDGYYISDGTNNPNLIGYTGKDGTSTGGSKYTVIKAPLTIDAGEKTGKLPYVGLIPQDIYPTITPDENAGVTTVRFMWYFRKDSGELDSLTQNGGSIYFDGSEENYRGKVYMYYVDKAGYQVGDTVDNVFCTISVDTNSGGFNTFLSGYSLTMANADLSEAIVTVTNADELIFGAPSGTPETRTLAFTVENAAGDSLTEGTDYQIQNNSNQAAQAGEHTLILEGLGSYAGSTLEYQWTIEPMTLGELAEQNVIRKEYDGTADLPSDFVFIPSFLTNGFNYVLNDGDYTMEGSYDSVAAGENKNVTFKLTLVGDNYLFSNGEKTMDVTVSKDCSILKADAPAAQNGELTIVNHSKAEYTYDASALLPTLDGTKEYGNISYSIQTVDLGQYYSSSEAATIDADGLLTLPIQENATDVTGKVGTVTVWAAADNYREFALTIDVQATNRILPTGTPTPSKTMLTYGEALSEITLSGEMKDGENTVAGTFAWDDASVVPNAGSYQAGWTFTPADTGKYAQVNGTITITVEKAKATGTPTYTMLKEEGKTLADAQLGIGTITPDGTIAWALPEDTVVIADTAYEWVFTPDDAVNYDGLSGKIILYSTKLVPTGAPTPSKTTLTYGEALSAITLSGEMKDGATAVAGTFAWDDASVVPNAGSYQAGWTFTPADTGKYAPASGIITITVEKAKATGTPSYTAIKQSGKTLADAQLGVGTITPSGKIAWALPEDTVVKANTHYAWVFTPDDAANYDGLTGSIRLFHKSSGGSSGGGGSSSGGSTATDTKTDTTTSTDTSTNTDGSVTKTETKADGTVVETTTKPDGTVKETETKPDGTVTTTETNADGSETKTETKPDGSSVTETKDANGSVSTVTVDANGKTEAEASISAKAIEDAKQKDAPVQLPVQVKAEKDKTSAPVINIDMDAPAGEQTELEIPVDNVTNGTVAILVKEDGTEEIIKSTRMTDNGIQISVSGNAKVKIVDNSKDFIDTQNHWSKDAVDYVVARGLFSGVSGDTFGVSQRMTRGMVNTVLARLAGVDTSGGSVWYEKGNEWAKANGISDGTNPEANVSREQFVTMLNRFAGSPAVSGELNFADEAQVSAYARNAMIWAVQNGIISGMGDNRIAPTAEAERAQVAAMFARYLKMM